MPENRWKYRRTGWPIQRFRCKLARRPARRPRACRIFQIASEMSCLSWPTQRRTRDMSGGYDTPHKSLRQWKSVIFLFHGFKLHCRVSRPCSFHVAVFVPRLDRPTTMRCGVQRSRRTAYGAIARASATKSSLFQSSRGPAAARAKAHSRTRL